ncbi:MAG: hypothetical protein EOP06_06205 [Proteobacteria bacterium]|nr:MAG: hypothetical protein EOP06_06205 [Pseudomonadota bacterium]
MKFLIALALLSQSPTAFAALVDTVNCPDGQSHVLSYTYQGENVPGYFVSDGRFYKAAGFFKSDGVVVFHSFNGSIAPDEIYCKVASYKN